MFGALGANLPQIAQDALDVSLFLLQVADLPVDHVHQHLSLGEMAGVGIVERQEFLDLLQGKAEVLAAQDEDQPGPITP
jgi:hypothetical protein